MKLNWTKKLIRTGLAAVSAGALLAVTASAGLVGAQQTRGIAPQGQWATDSTWYDGLVEKAVYDAEKVIYGHPRQYEALILTNKEQHDVNTWTKANGSDETVEVWKHNKIEVVPTPNYKYKFETTSHFDVNDLTLTRMDATSQEWCGTSFKQYLREGRELAWDFFQFSYMPEAGRVNATVEQQGDVPTVPFNGLSLFLRGYDFQSRQPLELNVLPDQKANGLTPHEPFGATVEFAGETEEGYKLDVKREGELLGTFTFAKDRRHVMLRYEGANGDSYRLKSLDRVDYWTRDE